MKTFLPLLSDFGQKMCIIYVDEDKIRHIDYTAFAPDTDVGSRG